ncbi:MAG: laccase domain-containing protein [Pseudomonadota bacterium]|jgi:copper oxidase (laccase) domain-containing protein
MIDPFSIKNVGQLELLVYQPWWELGIKHGMTTTQLSLKGADLDDSALKVCESLGVDRLLIPAQTHGAEFFDARDESDTQALLKQHGDLTRRVSVDALIAPLSVGASSNDTERYSFGYGILTADCVPIIVMGSNGVALIHAGWRGLANGIIKRVVSQIGGPSQAVILACAGGKSYEVGLEVIEAIGESAVFERSPDGRLYLDTALTAAKQLRAAAPGIAIAISGICTISDKRFHSYRRSGDLAGRCVTVYVPPGRENSARIGSN